MFFLIYFFAISCAAMENTFFRGIATVFVSNDVFQWGLISWRGLNFKIKNFPIPDPQKHEFLDPFWRDLENLRPKTHYNGEAHK